MPSLAGSESSLVIRAGWSGDESLSFAFPLLVAVEPAEQAAQRAVRERGKLFAPYRHSTCLKYPVISVSQRTLVSGGDCAPIRGILGVISARTGRDGGA